MRDLIVDLLIVPMPVLWLMLLALLAWRWRGLSHGLFQAATLLLAVLSMPLIGKLLLAPLAAAAVPYGTPAASSPAAIVVPTGGSFPDGAGRWWPTESSIVRAVAARKLQQELGLPLILSGGSVLPGEPAQAVTTAEALALVGPQVRFDTTASNSAESAAAVAEMLEESGRRSVILVTSPSHVARMSATLRHYGIAVFAAPVVDPRPPEPVESCALCDLIPSSRGLGMSRSALWEYMGIGWYLVTGRIALADLSAENS